MPAYADDLTQTQIYNLLNNSSFGQQATYNRVNNIYSDVHTYLPSLTDIKNYLNGIDQRFQTLNNSLVNSGGILNNRIANISLNSTSLANSVSSIQSGLSSTLPDINNNVRYLQEVLANSTDAAIRRDQASRVDQINDDFLSSSGSSSVSLGDLGSASDSITQLKGSLSGGASASSLWSVLGSGSDSWGWFSSATAADLDTSGQLMSIQNYSFLDQYYQELGLSLGGAYND